MLCLRKGRKDLMTKLYLSYLNHRRVPEKGFDVCFVPSPERALAWTDRTTAENVARVDLEKANITLTGTGPALSNFRVEELGPEKFVIFCEAQV
jgi:hypothetical protein